MLLFLLGALEPLDRMFVDARFRIADRAPTSGLAVVEIDARSLDEINVWPWPREIHALLVDRLTAAGAKTIFLDIDFSSWSDPESDEAFARALTASTSRIILPIFQQRGSRHGNTDGSQRSDPARDGPVDGDISFKMPIPPLREPTVPAVVNVFAENDSRVRRYATTQQWGDHQVPTVGMMLAGERAAPEIFYLDYGIRIDEVPSWSYADVIAERVPPEAFAGRTVLVGATAIELGDTFAVPLHAAMPGVFLHALAYESIVQSRAIQRLGPVPVLVACFLIAVIFGPAFATLGWRWGALTVFGISGASFGVTLGVQVAVPIIVDIIPFILAAIGAYGIGLGRYIDRQAYRIFVQRMAVLHRRAVMQSLADEGFDGIVVANHAGRIEMFNPSAEALLGISAADVVREPLAGVVRFAGAAPLGFAAAGLAPMEPGAVVVAPVDADADAGEDRPIDEFRLIAPREDGRRIIGPEETMLLHADGSEVPVEIVATDALLRISRNPLERRRLHRQVRIITFRDIAARQQAAAAQQAAMDELIAANRSKSEFLAIMSHELHTPLNAIIGFSEVLQGQLFGPLGSEKYEAYVKDILSSGRHLLALIDDILDVSRVEAGQYKLEEGSVSLSLRSLIRPWACCGHPVTPVAFKLT